jgi:hypothetical protein
MAILIALVALIVRLGGSLSASTTTAALNWGFISTIVSTLLVPRALLGARLLAVGIGIVTLVVLLLIASVVSLIVPSRTSLVSSSFSLRVVSTLLAVVSIALV